MIWIKLLILFIVFVLPHIIRKYAQKTKCPHCGKGFAMREVRRDDTPVSHHKITAKTGIYTSDMKGNYINADAQYVPATEFVYRCVDACRFCNFEKEELRTEVRKDK